MIETSSRPPAPASPSRAPGPSEGPPEIRYAFLLGRGRTGTTWIGQVLNQFPGCHYKYEPFLAHKPAEFVRWLGDLEGADRDELRARFRRLCDGCFLDVDFPPFLRKTCRRQSPALLRAAWQIGKLWPPARGLYQWYGRPAFRAGDWVLIKQVNFPNEKLGRLAEVLAPKVVALVRNPYASVDASLRFAAGPNGRPVKRPESLREVAEELRTLGALEIPVTPEELADLSDAAFAAVTWRIQIEPMVAFARSYENGYILKYEDFAERPKEAAREVYRFLGWGYDDAIDRFIDRTSQGGDRRPGRRNSDFSIYRDSRTMIHRWRQELSPGQVQDIRRILQGCRLMDLWPELDDPKVVGS
jgi:hypothetical protein